MGQGGAATGTALMVPSCFSSPWFEDKVDFGIWIPLLYSGLLLIPALPLHLLSPLESPVYPRPAPVHLPLWQWGEQHPAPGISIPQSTEFAASFGSPRNIYRLLGQGAEQ